LDVYSFKKGGRVRKVTGFVRTNACGSECHFEFDVQDSATVDEIEEEAKAAAFDMVEWSYEIEGKEGA
jgi:hypothetical protein